MKIIICGATGFIGRHLVRFFAAQGNELVVVCRNQEKARKLFAPSAICLPWRMHDPSPWLEQLNDADALINLIGENIFARLWTPSYKDKLLRSRIEAVETIYQAFRAVKTRRCIYLQASAVGYYGHTRQAVVDEHAPKGDDFLAHLAYQWERASEPIADLGIRRILLRFGVILGPDGGAFARLRPIYRWFLGGTLGKGTQGLPWMHIRDVQEAIRFLLVHESTGGVFNFVAPQAISQKEFSAALAAAVGRPAPWKIPAFLVKLLFGEMGQCLLLNGQYVKPASLLALGYSFRFAELALALHDLVRESHRPRYFPENENI